MPAPAPSRALAAAGAKAAYSSMTRKLDVASRQNITSASQSPALDSLACTTVAAPGGHQRPGLQEDAEPGGSPRRQVVQPRHPGRLLAGAAHAAPLPDPDPDQQGTECRLDHQGGGRGGGARLRRLAPGHQDHGRDHHHQARQPAEYEGESFPDALLARPRIRMNATSVSGSRVIASPMITRSSTMCPPPSRTCGQASACAATVTRLRGDPAFTERSWRRRGHQAPGSDERAWGRS